MGTCALARWGKTQASTSSATDAERITGEGGRGKRERWDTEQTLLPSPFPELAGGSVWGSNPPEPPKASPDGFEDRAGHQAQSAPTYRFRSAMVSISTRACFGSAATATVERAGRCVPKWRVYTSFIAAKSAMSVR